MLARIPALALLAGALALAGSPPLAAADPDDRILPFDAVERTLANGLEVIVVPTGFPNLVSLQIPVQTGSRNEVEPGKSGFAHFFEHMMFRGTERYPPDAYQSILTRAGARQNAYTTDDFTNYHVTFAKQDLAKILEIEADRFQNLNYSEEAFKTEARAVLGEYNKNSANPISKLLEAQRDAAFDVHSYQHTTMGFLEDIEDMPNEFAYSRQFFDRWYRPEHTTLIVAGDVTAEEVLPLVEKHWGSWRRGTYRAEVPAEPAPSGPAVAHVEWESPTLPWVSVGFHGPAFAASSREWAALDVLTDLVFGPTSPLYQKLVVEQQTVDQMFSYYPGNQDSYLLTVFARVKRPEDAAAVRDAILGAFAEARVAAPSPRRIEEAKSNARYGLLRSLDNTEAIASLLARFVRYERSFDTLDELYRTYDRIGAADLEAAARKYFVDAGLVQATLAHEPLPAAVAELPALASLAGAEAVELATVVQRSPLPQLDVKLLFAVGSAHDPKGKEGLAALAAAMIDDAGSRALRIDEIRKALYPMAASFSAQVDKEMTTFTARVHRDNWPGFAAVVLPMLTEPGFRAEDFARLKDRQLNALRLDLRTNNEEELGKERLQELLFAGTPYRHPVLGTIAGIEAITIDDVRDFVARAYTRAALVVGLAGDLPEGIEAGLGRELARLPAGPALPAPAGVVARRPEGIEIEVVAKPTRATAISLGHPIAVTRAHPDFAALYLARTWLGEHRSSTSHLYQRIREVRGMNYGDYAYIEAFPRGMYQFFPDPNLGRQAQVFEIWIRPVVPENAHMALRIALHELRRLIRDGLTAEQFESTRDYLSKNVFLMTSTQDQQLGYALDSRWYGIGEFTAFLREKLAALTVEDVNRAIREHLSGENLQVVMITEDAAGLRAKLLADEPSTIRYDAEKPAELLAEDEVIGALKLGLEPGDVTVTLVDEVFAK